MLSFFSHYFSLFSHPIGSFVNGLKNGKGMWFICYFYLIVCVVCVVYFVCVVWNYLCRKWFREVVKHTFLTTFLIFLTSVWNFHDFRFQHQFYYFLSFLKALLDGKINHHILVSDCFVLLCCVQWYFVVFIGVFYCVFFLFKSCFWLLIKTSVKLVLLVWKIQFICLFLTYSWMYFPCLHYHIFNTNTQFSLLFHLI